MSTPHDPHGDCTGSTHHEATGLASKRNIMVTNPRNGEVITSVHTHTAAEVDQVFSKARVAVDGWARTSVQQRARVMLRLHDLLLERREEILETIQAETGKNLASALEELMECVNCARLYGKRAPKLLRDRRVRGAIPGLTRTVVQREAVGAVGIISPWNYPLALTLGDAIPALVAGNAVVLKPDSATPCSALLAGALLKEAGLPEDVFTVVLGEGRTVGDQVARNCDYLMFTGSTRVARKLGEIAGQRLIGFSAELGGKNPMIVTPLGGASRAVQREGVSTAPSEVDTFEATLRRVVRTAANACFSNSGQLCVSIERIYVHHGDFEAFVSALVEHVEGMKIGTGGWDEDMGSMISAEQVDSVMDFVNDATAHGATLHCGGRIPELGAAFLRPVVLTDVNADMKLEKMEVFGPVVFVRPYDDLEEAVELANDTPYGLNASVVGNLPKQEMRALARRIHAGSVNINEGYAATFGSVRAPMGGWKDSGIGRRHGDEGLLKYTESRTVAEQPLMPLGDAGQGNRQQQAEWMLRALKWGKHIL